MSEIGYYRAQGDNVASPNPPVGALLTYYLARRRPGDAKVVLTVDDADGKMVRQIDGASKAGLHRTAWDLRETPPPAPQGQGQRAGEAAAARVQRRLSKAKNSRRRRAAVEADEEGKGPLVKPGTYTVTLGKLVNGAVTPMAKSQTVEVVPLEASNR